MKLEKLAGATSEIWQIFIQDSSSTTGAGLTGLTNASGSLTAYYHRDTDTTATAISLVTMTVGTFTSSGFKEVDATNMPGWYQFCPPNAAIASGAKSCAFHIKGATNMAPLPIEVQLVAYNPDATLASQVPTAAQIATGVWQDTTAGDFTTALSVGKSVMNGVSLGTGLTIAAVSGAVGSVTGAVGSVTGNVGGNVTGSVGAVVGLTASNLDATVSSRAVAGDAMALTAGERTTLTAAIWAYVVTGSTTVVQAMRGFIAAMLGKSSGLDLGTPTYRNIADSKDVITATADANGNRSIVTLDLT